MQKFTVHKVSTVHEIYELPDFNFLLANFIENFIICCSRKKTMEKINMSGRKRAVLSLWGFFDPADISELTGLCYSILHPVVQSQIPSETAKNL